MIMKYIEMPNRSQKNESSKEHSTSLIGNHRLKLPGGLSIDEFEEVIRRTTLSPSGDNSQHWKFGTDESSISILNDRDKSHFNYSFNGLAQYVSYGAVAESLKISCSKFLKKVEIDFLANDMNQENIAKCKISNSNSPKDPLEELLEYRHTNRSIFKKDQVKESFVDILRASTEEFTQANISLISSLDKRAKLADLVKTGDRFVWETKVLHSDLFKWVRFNNNSLDGLTIGSLGLAPQELLIFPFLKFWQFTQIVNCLGFSRFLAAPKGEKLMLSSPLHVVITIQEPTLSNYFEAGRAMQRFWITANSLGLSIQPMTSPVMLLFHQLYGGKKEFKPFQLGSLGKIKEKWQELFDIEKQIPAMLFRVGFAEGPKHFALRRDIDSFLVKGNSVQE